MLRGEKKVQQSEDECINQDKNSKVWVQYLSTRHIAKLKSRLPKKNPIAKKAPVLATGCNCAHDKLSTGNVHPIKNDFRT